MKLVNELLSNIFDYAYHKLVRKKICNNILVHDFFDGKEYGIDEFYEKHKAYIDRPLDFFNSIISDKQVHLYEGEHFNTKYLFRSKSAFFKSMLFESPVSTEYRENNLVPFKWFQNETKRSDVLILFSPGGWRPNQKIEENFCQRLKDNGIDAGLLTVPYHQSRTPSGAYSGEYFISGNIFWTIKNFRQYVAEIILLIRYMRKHYKYIGIVGMSSGGFYANHAANLEELDFNFPFITGCKLGSITWNGNITKYAKIDMQKKGISEADLNRAWSITDQLHLCKEYKVKNTKHYISLFDDIVPTEYQYLLWEVFGKHEKMELECGHNSSFFMLNKVADDISAFVQKRI